VGGRPTGPSRFGVTPRHPRLSERTVSRNSPLRVYALLPAIAKWRCSVWRTSGGGRPGRIGDRAQGLSSARCSGRRPVAGSRRRDDRAVRGRPGNPEPSHSRPTRPHASAAASHPPPTPGHAPSRLVARCSATRTRRPCNARPGRTSWSFPRPVRRRSWGSVRSALRRFAPADGWCVTFPCDRARVSFVPPSSARLIFVGWPAAHGSQIA